MVIFGLFIGLLLAAYFNLYNAKHLGHTILVLGLIIFLLAIIPIFTKIPALIISLVLSFAIYQYWAPIYLNFPKPLGTIEDSTSLNNFFTNYIQENNNINLNLYKVISTDNYFVNLKTSPTNLLIANIKNTDNRKNINYFKDDIFTYFTFSKHNFDLIVLNSSSFNKENLKFLNLTTEKLNKHGLFVLILNKENNNLNLFNQFSTNYPNAVLIELDNYAILLNKSINFKIETNLKNIISP